MYLMQWCYIYVAWTILIYNYYFLSLSKTFGIKKYKAYFQFLTRALPVGKGKDSFSFTEYKTNRVLSSYCRKRLISYSVP